MALLFLVAIPNGSPPGGIPAQVSGKHLNFPNKHYYRIPDESMRNEYNRTVISVAVPFKWDQ